MADAVKDIQANYEEQLSELKSELARISKEVSSRATDALESVDEVYKAGKKQARHVTNQISEQSHAAYNMARENPVATSSIVLSAGLIGLAAGILLAKSCSRH